MSQYVEMEASARLTVLFLWRKMWGKQSSYHKEINKGSETPALTKKTCKYQEAWKDKCKWLRLDGKEIKMFCAFCREFPNRKNIQYSLRIRSCWHADHADCRLCRLSVIFLLIPSFSSKIFNIVSCFLSLCALCITIICALMCTCKGHG